MESEDEFEDDIFDNHDFLEPIGDTSSSSPEHGELIEDIFSNIGSTNHQLFDFPEQNEKLEVVLYHKPKGSKGLWKEVENAERLRVTKGFGKRLKLKIISTTDFDKKTLIVQLFDLDLKTPFNPEKNPSSNSFTIESAKIHEKTVEVALKIYRMGGRFRFVCQVQTTDGVFISGGCDEFISYSSGSVREKRKAEPTKKKAKMDLVEINPGVPPIPKPQDIAVTTVPGSLDVKGVVKAKAFMQMSDLRLKTNISDIVDAIHIVTALQGKRYQWKDSTNETVGGRQVIGFIAQEVQKILPEVVHQDPDSGLFSVSYAELLPVLIEAFKQFLKDYSVEKHDLQSQITDLKLKLDNVSSELELTTDNHNRIRQIIDGLDPHLQKIRDLKSLEALLPKKPSESAFERYKRKGNTFCRITQMIFATFLALSVILSVIGLVIAYSNNSSGNLLFTDEDNDDNSEYYHSYTPSNNNHGQKWDRYMMTGLAIFGVGVFSTIVTATGLFCSSLFICYHRRQLIQTKIEMSKL